VALHSAAADAAESSRDERPDRRSAAVNGGRNAAAGDPGRGGLPGRCSLQAIGVGGLAAGVLDLAYAIGVYSPRHPIRIPQTIASGLLGPGAYDGGAAVAVLGVVLHFVIALGAASVYFLASRRLPLLTRRAVLSGTIFGGLVYLFMHGVVLPLSAVAHRHQPWIYQAAEFVEHWLFVGLPIALSVRRYSRPPAAGTGPDAAASPRST
jgi:hypothetical protein